MNNKRKNTSSEEQIRKEALKEIETLLEEGVAPRPPKKQVAKKTAPKKAPVPKKAPAKVYRIDSLTLLITVPQWEGEESLEELLEQTKVWFQEKGKEVKEAIVTIEKHGQSENAKGHEEGQDPGRHIHACIKLDKKICTRNTAYFDSLYGKHGKVETCRDYKACQIYCCKKGNEGNWITHNVDIEAVIESTKSKKGVKHETVANFIRKKERTMEEIDEKFPGYLIQHQTKVKDYCLLQEGFRNNKLQPYYGIDQAKTMMSGNPELIRIVGWLNENLNKPRDIRQKHLWIWGDKKLGKSRLQGQLSEYFNAYFVANEDKWWSGMDNTKQIILFDEYTGFKTIADMKQLLQGNKFPMPQKGTQPFIKRKNIPTIICANSSPEQVYHKVMEERPQEFGPFLDRLLVINVTREFEVPWLTAPVQDESPDEDEQDEPTQPAPEPPHRPGTPPITPRVLKRGKPLEPEQVQLQCQEEMDLQDHSQDSDAVEWDEQPEQPEDISQHSQQERILKAKALYKQYNK
jgi:hypothetical protein